MTEYGRGQEGSEPWHPQDPYYGDGGWEGQQGHVGHQAAYGGQPQHYPQQPQQQSEYGDWGTGQQGDHGQAQQQYQQQYDQQQYDPNQNYDQQQYAPQQHQQPQQQYDNNGWGTGTHTHVQYTDPSDPYGQQAAAYGTGEQPDYYGTPDAYPPPEPPSRRRTEPEPQRADWDPGPDQGEHAFFAGGGDDEDDAEDTDDQGGRGDRRGRGGKKPKKRRSGCACLVVLLVLGGGVGGVGYFGYQFYQDRFSSAPDFAGDGTSATVSVVVPKGANGADMGRLLKEAGVVKSVDAFVSAFTQNDDSGRIQAGAYVLNKEMSAKSAVELMLDPKSQNAVMVTPGQRNIAVYKSIDDKLGLKSGATRKAAEAKFKSLGLPDWAEDDSEMKDPLEGFLYPGTYPAADGMKPETVLKEMVARAAKKYAAFGLEAKAKALKLDSPMEIITIASLVQAEGKTTSDYRRMAEVVYNRLDYSNPQTYGFLQFDSTFNYAKNESNIDISESEINKDKDPYNTYTNKGLPPGPIGNPGEDAIKSTLNPTDDGWYYFVATDGVSKTEFARTHEEFQKLKDKFDASRGN
ncbi:endolytic transglycosylase MltG [Streptomyces sp. NPDC001652]|uniref:endolytic transglycosylase MltG n=1 Tax=Streptomyces sp. NPDC001652 TaxID=3154393 RepID=UPI00332C1D2E